jgi:hypothetical protein
MLTLWTSTMGPHTLRDMLADLLQLPQQRVRVLTNMVGGGYGSKMYLRAIKGRERAARVSAGHLTPTAQRVQIFGAIGLTQLFGTMANRPSREGRNERPVGRAPRAPR